MLCAIQNVSEIKVLDIIPGDKVRVANLNEPFPSLQHILLLLEWSYFSADDVWTLLQSENSFHKVNLLGMQLANARYLDHWIALRNWKSFQGRALNIEGKDSQRSNIADFHFWMHILKIHIDFQLAPWKMPFLIANLVLASRNADPTHSPQLLIDHETQRERHIGFVSSILSHTLIHKKLSLIKKGPQFGYKTGLFSIQAPKGGNPVLSFIIPNTFLLHLLDSNHNLLAAYPLIQPLHKLFAVRALNRINIKVRNESLHMH